MCGRRAGEAVCKTEALPTAAWMMNREGTDGARGGNRLRRHRDRPAPGRQGRAGAGARAAWLAAAGDVNAPPGCCGRGCEVRFALLCAARLHSEQDWLLVAGPVRGPGGVHGRRLGAASAGECAHQAAPSSPRSCSPLPRFTVPYNHCDSFSFWREGRTARCVVPRAVAPRPRPLRHARRRRARPWRS